MEIFFPAGTDFLFVKYCIVATCFLLTFLLIGSHKKRVKRLNTYYFAVFFFFCSIVVHTIFLSTEYESSMERALFSLASISMFFLFIHYKNLLLKGIFTYLYLISAVILISSNLIILSSPSVINGLFKGIFLNPNILGFQLSIIFLPLFYNKSFYDFFRKKKIFTLNNFITLNLIFLLIITKARSALLVLGIISIILLFKYEKRLKKRLIVLLMGVFSMLLIGTTTNFLYNLVNKYEDTESVFQTRGYLYLSRLNGISQRPYLGWGFQVNPTHGKYLQYHSSNKLEKGNMYLAIIEEFGIFLGSIMIFIIFYIGRKSYYIRDEYFFISLTILGTLVHLNFESWFLNFNAVNTFIFWIYVFLVPSLTMKKSSKSDSGFITENSTLSNSF